MPESQYNWKHGPDKIKQHSIAKHRILEAYLAAYFQTLVGNQRRDEFRLTLVDGFAGGGRYVHEDTNKLADGSPLILLAAVREAEFKINHHGRQKQVKLDVTHFFIERNRDAYLHLKKVLQDDGYQDLIGSSIQLRNSRFEDEIDDIIEMIKRKSPRNGRSIFILDQYGYKQASSGLIRRILSNLPGAEIILTFGVDSLLNYANDTNLEEARRKIELPDFLGGKTLNEIKSSERDWRLFIQVCLYKQLVLSCGAQYYTPFFIRNKRGHGDYWLIHMSQHYRARDVMTQVHWDNHNYFIHYAGSGLDMFNIIGYDPEHDSAYKNQGELGFEFDAAAEEVSIQTMMEQAPKLIYAHDEGVSFGELFIATCNGSPASAAIYKKMLIRLAQHELIEIQSLTGGQRRSAHQIQLTDQIRPPAQRPLFI